MLGQIRRQFAWMVVPLSLLLISVQLSDAAIVHGGHGGGHGGGAHHSAPRPPSHASVMRAPAARAAKATHAATAPHNSGNATHNVTAHSPASHNNAANHNNSNANLNNSSSHNSANRGGVVNHGSTARSANQTGTMSLAARIATIHPPTTYAYGTGSVSRHYRPSGYGRGYRNRYYGNSRNYGRSQSQDRSIVARLRSVHSTLMRIDHDYRGHRARAAHEIRLAIHDLSHRSTRTNYNGISGQSNMMMAGMNGNQNFNGVNGARRQNGNGNGNGNGQRIHLTQAQSDSRMAQALRTTQGISMQLNHQGSYSTRHQHAQSRIHRAMHEMNVALAVR